MYFVVMQTNIENNLMDMKLTFFNYIEYPVKFYFRNGKQQFYFRLTS